MFLGFTHEPYSRKTFFLVSVLYERPEADTVAALTAETISRRWGTRNGVVAARVVAAEPDNKEEKRRRRLVQQAFISFLVGLEHCC